MFTATAFVPVLSTYGLVICSGVFLVLFPTFKTIDRYDCESNESLNSGVDCIQGECHLQDLKESQAIARVR